MHPAISVVIPVYCAGDEHEQHLMQALESVAAQTFRDFEVIIVDDCSPRELPLTKTAEALPEVRVIRNATNCGHAESRNAGIRAAQASLIAFLDQDDIWLPEKLEKQLAFLQDDNDAAMVFCDVEKFGPRTHRLRIDQSIIPDRPSFYWFVCHGNFTITATAVLVKKQAMLDIGLFDSRYSTCDDFDAWLKILMNAPIAHMRQTLARYRLHDFNTSYSVDRLNDNKLLTQLIVRYYKTAPPLEKLKLLPRLARKLAGRAYFTLRRYRTFRDA